MVFKAILLLAAYAAWQKWELTKFGVTEYEISSEKLEKEACVAVIADLHGYSYGEKNERLLAKLRELSPHAILIPGDMVVSKDPRTYATALEALRGFSKIAPVYYSYGNHETRLRCGEDGSHPLFGQYLDAARRMGVTLMATESMEVSLGGGRVMLSSLELGLEYYKKGRPLPLEKGYLEENLPMRKPELFQILLAHNPAYARDYARWGADVAFCGHNHGGLIRIPGIGSVISPQLTLFPKYDAGLSRIGKCSIVTSRGMGTHTYHIRVFNRAELVLVRLIPAKPATTAQS